MGVANVPAAAGGGIKSVQRGSAAGAGNVTITAVDIAKSFVTVFGTASAGTVSSSFGLNAANFSLTGVGVVVPGINNVQARRPNVATGAGGTTSMGNAENDGYWTLNTAVNAMGVNAGSNNLVAAVAQGFLADSTTLTVSHACRFEVVEFA